MQLTAPLVVDEVREALKEMGPMKALRDDSVICKIVAKVLVNRMKGVMDSCIDKSQSVFVPSRLIYDNVLLAYEILHTFRQKLVGNKGFLALKLDMSKAYNRVEWVS
ncbi:reverse transcriptase [Gossypium australe]|uniref:Reverse transcriptase n=1 Tax=Gossypium australe TaxID=47621 RepID=A0A5B6WVC7_9ROSI|nr:reverse transcriptase [Gossypium australe]